MPYMLTAGDSDRKPLPIGKFLPATLVRREEVEGQYGPRFRWVFEVTDTESGMKRDCAVFTGVRLIHPSMGRSPARARIYELLSSLEGRQLTPEECKTGIDIDQYIGRDYEVLMEHPKDNGWQDIKVMQPRSGAGGKELLEPVTLRDKLSFPEWTDLNDMWQALGVTDERRHTILERTDLEPTIVLARVRDAYKQIKPEEFI